MPGDWMSVSTMPTRRPVIATAVARLAVRFDFPVPPRYEWMDTIIPIQPAYVGPGGGVSPRSARGALEVAGTRRVPQPQPPRHTARAGYFERPLTPGPAWGAVAS